MNQNLNNNNLNNTNIQNNNFQQFTSNISNQTINNNTTIQNEKILKINNINLIITITNVIFCIVGMVITTKNLIESMFSAESGGSSGWFLILLPILISMYLLACIPDFACLIFSVLYKKKNKNNFLILTIIFAVIGCLMGNLILKELVIDTIIIYPYYALKVIIIIYNIILLIISKNINPKNYNHY